MGNVYVFDHPLIQHKMGILRDKNTSTKDFRELTREISMMMTYEATRSLPLQDVEVETPIRKATVKMLKGEDIAIVPILGLVSGWSMVCRLWYQMPKLAILGYIETLIHISR